MVAGHATTNARQGTWAYPIIAGIRPRWCVRYRRVPDAEAKHRDCRSVRSATSLRSSFGAQNGTLGASSATWVLARGWLGGHGRASAEACGVAAGRQAEVAFVFPVELGRAVVSDLVADCCDVVHPGHEEKT